MPRKTSLMDVEEVYVLRGPRGSDLDKYVFTDEAHARNWFGAKWNPAANGRTCQRWRVRRVTCSCGREGVVRFLRLLQDHVERTWEVNHD